MMDLWSFALLVDDIAPKFEMIHGRVFIDRERIGKENLSKTISSYADDAKAQYWINMVPIDDLLDGVAENWSMEDPYIEKIVDVYRRSWMAIIYQQLGRIDNLTVMVLKDDETGDVIVQLRQM